MNEFLQHSWWMLALRGMAAVLFGVLALAWPDLTLLMLVALFAAFALVSGGASVWAAYKAHKGAEGRWLIALIGVIGIGAGAATIAHPLPTPFVLILGV